MKKLPISIQTFEDIRKEGMIYVDKTAFLWEMTTKGRYYFFARPRRFGKSLMLTTLKSYFEGRKDLFEGLYIAGKEQKWKKHRFEIRPRTPISYYCQCFYRISSRTSSKTRSGSCIG